MVDNKIVKISKGQVWQHNDPRPRRCRVIAVSALSTGRRYATLENVATSRITRVSLDRLRPASHWRLVEALPAATQSIPGVAENPVAPDPSRL